MLIITYCSRVTAVAETVSEDAESNENEHRNCKVRACVVMATSTASTHNQLIKRFDQMLPGHSLELGNSPSIRFDLYRHRIESACYALSYGLTCKPLLNGHFLKGKR